MLPEEETERPALDAAPQWRGWDVVLAVGVGLAFGFLLVVVFALAVGIATGPDNEMSSTLANAIATSIVYAGLLASVWFLIIVRRKLSWRDVGLYPPDKGYILRTIGVWILTIVGTVIVGLIVTSLFGDPPDVREQLQVEQTEVSGAEVLALLVASVVAAPLVEEIVFRGLIFATMRRRWSFWLSAIASSLLFAVAHQTLILIPALSVLGFALAWLTERYGSIYPAIVLHGLNNGLAIVVFLTLTN